MAEELYHLAFLDAAQIDYDQLDGSQKKLVDKALDRIKIRGMNAGQPLAGKLIQCRKIKHRQAGLRIIFTQLDKQIKIIEIVAIGKREYKKVYRQAEKRLR